MRIHLEAAPLKPLRYFDRPSEDTPRRVYREAELLRVGTFKGRDFTESDLHDLAASAVAERRPLQVEHQMSLERYHGFIEAAKVVNEPGAPPRLLALLCVLGSWAVERVLDGRLSALSAGVLDTVPLTLEEVSFVRRGLCPTAVMLEADEEPDPQYERMRRAAGLTGK